MRKRSSLFPALSPYISGRMINVEMEEFLKEGVEWDERMEKGKTFGFKFYIYWVSVCIAGSNFMLELAYLEHSEIVSEPYGLIIFVFIAVACI